MQKDDLVDIFMQIFLSALIYMNVGKSSYLKRFSLVKSSDMCRPFNNKTFKKLPFSEYCFQVESIVLGGIVLVRNYFRIN